MAEDSGNGALRRIHITLPEKTVEAIDRVAPKGDRSRLIELAITHYLETLGKTQAQKLLAEQPRRAGRRKKSGAAEAWLPFGE